MILICMWVPFSRCYICYAHVLIHCTCCLDFSSLLCPQYPQPQRPLPPFRSLSLSLVLFLILPCNFLNSVGLAKYASGHSLCVKGLPLTMPRRPLRGGWRATRSPHLLRTHVLSARALSQPRRIRGSRLRKHRRAFRGSAIMCHLFQIRGSKHE
jgi:hypothetical protein